MNFRIARLAAAAVLLVAATGASAQEYKFVVANNTSSTITKLQVSEDGDTWRNFNIGRGIPAGQRAEMIWDESTNNSGCEWVIKAHYADGSESAPADFNFCEADLELEFSE